MSRREYHYFYHGKNESVPTWGEFTRDVLMAPVWFGVWVLVWTAPVTVPLAVVTGFGVAQNYQDCGAMVCDR